MFRRKKGENGDQGGHFAKLRQGAAKVLRNPKVRREAERLARDPRVQRKVQEGLRAGWSNGSAVGREQRRPSRRCGRKLQNAAVG